MAGRTTIPIDGRLDGRRNVKDNPIPYDELPEDVKAFIARRGKDKGREATILDTLSSKHVLTILMYVGKMSPVVKSDIYNDVSRCSNMGEKIESLNELGLIKIYRPARTKTNVVVITDKGREVVARLQGILDVIDDKVPAENE